MINFDDFKPDSLQLKNKHLDLSHLFEEKDFYALWAAHAAGRPLLLRGQPGTGKSQLARAIADRLGWAFVSEVIHGNSELTDLHWSYDAVARLADAQTIALPGVLDNSEESVSEHIAAQKYLAPGAFWWGYHWDSAQDQYGRCKSHLRPAPVHATNPEQSPEGVVLLIDEIDKADPDLPNGLLETLANRKFTVPYLNEEVHCKKEDDLLVIFTTNEERELPTAFKRRCFVHTLKMEEDANTREDWLIQRGKLHFGDDVSEAAYRQAATLLWQDRDQPGLNYKPGLAEYIDLLKAVSSLPNKDEQIERLENINQFVLKKEMDEG